MQLYNMAIGFASISQRKAVSVYHIAILTAVPVIVEPTRDVKPLLFVPPVLGVIALYDAPPAV